MWALFTAALARGDSTTRVSIVNVSANFMITAILGWMIFGEKLNGTWWVGAGFLAAGNVVIGRREEGKKPGGSMGLDESVEEAEGLLGVDAGDTRGRAEGDEVELDENENENEGARLREMEREEHGRLRRAEEVDDPL